MPDVAWVTDITYVWTAEGWLHLAATLDLFSRRVVGFAIASTSTGRSSSRPCVTPSVDAFPTPGSCTIRIAARCTPAATTRVPSMTSASSAA